jgi:hypothetical protein
MNLAIRFKLAAHGTRHEHWLMGKKKEGNCTFAVVAKASIFGANQKVEHSQWKTDPPSANSVP